MGEGIGQKMAFEESALNQAINRIKTINKSIKPIIIGIEGFGGSGKSTLANKLKDKLNNCEVISIDAFIIKESAQQGKPQEDTFDIGRLEDQVLKPASSGGQISYQVLDWASNTLGGMIELSNLDYLIIEGITSFHPTIEDYYDFKIWVDTPIEISKQRGQLRDKGNENEAMWDKWADCDLVYKEKFHPENRADFIINNY